MDLLSTGYVIFSVIAGACVLIMLRYLTSFRRGFLAGMFGLLIMFVPGFGSELLSRPKPVDWEWFRAQTQEAEILAAIMKEGVGIYLWLGLPDTAEPRAYVLPWNTTVAQQLRQAMEDAKNHGMTMKLPFQHSWEDRESPFHPVPQPKLPDKGGQPPPEIYQHPDYGI